MQDMAAAAEVMRATPDAVPALLDAVLNSEAEQQAAALQDEARQLAEQRRGLQVLVLGLAGKCKRAAAAGLFAGTHMASSDECSEDECTAGAAVGVLTGGVVLVHTSAAAAEANDEGSERFAGSHRRPGLNVGHINKRKRGRKSQRDFHIRLILRLQCGVVTDHAWHAVVQEQTWHAASCFQAPCCDSCCENWSQSDAHADAITVATRRVL
jgi:hypothetical protein